jgi:hypothetical protein
LEAVLGTRKRDGGTVGRCVIYHSGGHGIGSDMMKTAVT